MPNKKINPNQLEDDNQNIIEPNAYLETEHAHKDWYNANQMGRQKGKPQMVVKPERKPKGTRKHSLRKEK